MAWRDKFKEIVDTVRTEVNEGLDAARQLGEDTGVTEAARNITGAVVAGAKDVSEKTGLSAQIDKAAATVKEEAGKGDGSLSSEVASAAVTGVTAVSGRKP